MPEMFITFEGIEGSGKTTQMKRLADALKGEGHEVLATREPGGTPIGERIRAILLDGGNGDMTPMAELFLYAAARSQHVERVIRPALDAGKVVLCDRYTDATRAYQGAARLIDPSIIDFANRAATGGLAPDLTILLDCPPESGLARARGRNLRGGAACGEDRFEREEMPFHRRVREGYLAIAREEPKRIMVVDAEQSEDEVHREILRIVTKEAIGRCGRG